MEIIKFFLDYFLSEYGGALAPIAKLFEENSFDIKSVINNITPETVAPIIKELLDGSVQNKNPTQEGRVYGLKPISAFADRDIVFRLNKYLSR